MIALLLLAVLVLILLNAFFVAAEFALVRSRKAHLQRDADAGRRGAAVAVEMMDDLSRYLSAAQVGITAASSAILRLLGVRTSGQLDDGETPEELRVLIQQSVTGGKLDPGEAGMLTGVFHLHEQQARQVMTPAPAVITVDASEDAE